MSTLPSPGVDRYVNLSPEDAALLAEAEAIVAAMRAPVVIPAPPPRTGAQLKAALAKAEENAVRAGINFQLSPAEKAAAYAARDAAAKELASVAKPAPPVPVGTQPAPVPSASVHLSTYFVSDQVKRFAGCVWVRDMHAIITPNGTTLDQKRFDVVFSGEYVMSLDGRDTTDSAWECFTSSPLHQFPKVDSTFFDPTKAPGLVVRRDGLTSVNTYVPLGVIRILGDASPFINHILKVFPNGNDAWIFIAYLAACVQYLGVKSTWAPLVQGVEGNGKSMIADVMAHALGRRYTHTARAAKIDGRFNSHLYGKLLVVVNEVKITEDRQGVWEALKTLITDAHQEIEYKGVDSVTRELCFNFLFFTNHQDAIAKTGNDRRICPLFAAQQTVEDLLRDVMIDANGTTSVYFDGLFDWLKNQDGFAIVADYLTTYPIPDELNFAKRCRRAPRTTSTEAAIAAGRGTAEQDVLEAIESGVAGFKGGWISSHALNTQLTVSGKARTVNRNKRREMLATLGYVPHPGVPAGRMTLALPDGTKPTLYVTRDHPTRNETNLLQIRQHYLEAQGS